MITRADLQHDQLAALDGHRAVCELCGGAPAVCVGHDDGCDVDENPICFACVECCAHDTRGPQGCTPLSEVR